MNILVSKIKSFVLISLEKAEGLLMELYRNASLQSQFRGYDYFNDKNRNLDVKSEHCLHLKEEKI